MNKNWNEVYGQLCSDLMADRESTKFEMVQNAARELFKAVQENYNDWPDLQDGGIFEQVINIAANMVLGVLGYKPQH